MLRDFCLLFLLLSFLIVICETGWWDEMLEHPVLKPNAPSRVWASLMSSIAHWLLPDVTESWRWANRRSWHHWQRADRCAWSHWRRADKSTFSLREGWRTPSAEVQWSVNIRSVKWLCVLCVLCHKGSPQRIATKDRHKGAQLFEERHFKYM